MHLVHPHEGEEKEEEKEEEKDGEEKEGEEKSDKKDEHADDHGGGHGKGHTPWLDEAEWPEFDSDKGPILKVYITDLAMQRQ